MDPNIISSNNHSPICFECERYKNRGIKDKIAAQYRRVPDTICMIKECTKKYRLKFYSQLFHFEEWARLGRAVVKKYENLECSNEDHAIIIVNFDNKSRIDKNNYIYGSGVEILITYFVAKPRKFKIYNCYNAICFQKTIEKMKAQNLWIFSHGDRHGISFGNKEGDYFPFCKLERKARWSFIAQLHCCHGTGKTMWEYSSTQPGIFSEGYRTIVQNREDIIKWIEKDKVELSVPQIPSASGSGD
jgi:hypothetical protein